MPLVGALGILVAFAAALGSAVLLALSVAIAKRPVAETLAWTGRLVTFVSAAALTLCVGILAFCFLTGNYSLAYVLENHSSATGSFAWLYRLSGIWAGREGSLLFWAWLISVFAAAVSARRFSKLEPLDTMAVAVMQAVLAAFAGVLLFSQDNMPFFVAEASNFNADGTLTAAASLMGMNNLLEHWAMAVHPPTLFVGYAACTVPFAYALAALTVNDASDAWVRRSNRSALIAWLFLSIGIGLGGVWAYVCLGWGGYWGWDPVENASLLPWLVLTALIHSFGLYKERNAAKGWSIMCAGLAFSFVILGTFISRSGLVQSVHAFDGDTVSLVLFLILIVVAVALPALGFLLRRRSFSVEEADEVQSFASRSALYFFNNVVMIAAAVLLAYMTLSSALPVFLPFGGQSFSASTYNALARPLGIAYFAMMALCPLLGWSKTDPAQFRRQVKMPALCALALFAVLCAYSVAKLFPLYDATLASGGMAAAQLAEQGPAFYYKGLAVLGMAVASLLLCDSLLLLVRNVRVKRKRAAGIGGALSHTGMAVLLVGLIGSSLFVYQVSGYLPFDEQSDSSTDVLRVDDYTLRCTGSSVEQKANGNVDYRIDLEVFAGKDAADGETGARVGQLSPSVTLVASTQQTQLNAGVLGFPLEDLFVVYHGVNEETKALSIDAMVNPLIRFVWIGFALLVAGMVVSVVGRREAKQE